MGVAPKAEMFKFWVGNHPDFIRRLWRHPNIPGVDLTILEQDYVHSLPEKVQRLQPNFQSDFIRTKYIMEGDPDKIYIWMDMDTVVLRPYSLLDYLVKPLARQDYHAVAFNEIEWVHHNLPIRVGLFSARGNCPLIRRWWELQNERLDSLREGELPAWITFGSKLATQAAIELGDSAKLLVSHLKLIEKLPWQAADLFYEDLDLSMVVDQYTFAVSLFNSQLLVKEFGEASLMEKLLRSYVDANQHSRSS